MSTSYRRGDVVQHRDTNARGTVVCGTDTIGLTIVGWWDGGTDTLPAVDLTIAHRRRYSPAVAAMIDGWDGGDVWGSAMSLAWAVAEVARAASVQGVDGTLDVSWGAALPMTIDEMADAGEDPDDRGDISFESATLASAYRDGGVTDADLEFAARVLSRYLDICRAAGRDY